MRIPLLCATAATLVCAAPFPKPNPGRVFSDLKVTASGSPIRIAKEDWPGVRDRVKNDPEWARWLSGRRAVVDDWIAHRRDKVEWIAGWYHDFVSPDDGSFLTWTPDEPGEYLSSPSDPQVKVTPKLHAAWVFHFRSLNASRMEEAAQLFRLTGEQRYADWVASQLDFYAGNYEKWSVQTRFTKARLMAQSLDEAVNLIKYVNAARLISAASSAQQKQHWLDKLFRPEAELINETMQRVHNIACWQRSAMAQVALLYQDDDLWRLAIDAPFGIRRQVADGITGDYLWFEQSLGYNSYVVRALLPLFTYAGLAGRLDDLRPEAAAVENLMLAPIMMRFPTGQLPNPADSTGGPGHAPDVEMLASAYRVFPTVLGVERARTTRDWNTLVDPPRQIDTDDKPDTLPEPHSLNMESSRMAIIRSGPWQVFFHYGQLDRSHAEDEALNYEAFYEATDITHDAGTVGYGSPLHSGFYTRGFAHNVPLIDREGQSGWAPGELIAFDAANARVSARQPEYRPQASAERELRIDGNRLIDTVRVKPAGGAIHKLGLVLNLQGTVKLPNGFEPVASPLPYWTETRARKYTDSALFAVDYPGRPIRVTIKTPGAFTVTYGSVPDVPPSRRAALYIEVEATEAEFTTVLESTI